METLIYYLDILHITLFINKDFIFLNFLLKLLLLKLKNIITILIYVFK